MPKKITKITINADRAIAFPRRCRWRGLVVQDAEVVAYVEHHPDEAFNRQRFFKFVIAGDTFEDARYTFKGAALSDGVRVMVYEYTPPTRAEREAATLQRDVQWIKQWLLTRGIEVPTPPTN
jgi:hypothetical protein